MITFFPNFNFVLKLCNLEIEKYTFSSFGGMQCITQVKIDRSKRVRCFDWPVTSSELVISTGP